MRTAGGCKRFLALIQFCDVITYDKDDSCTLPSLPLPHTIFAYLMPVMAVVRTSGSILPSTSCWHLRAALMAWHYCCQLRQKIIKKKFLVFIASCNVNGRWYVDKLSHPQRHTHNLGSTYYSVNSARTEKPSVASPFSSVACKWNPEAEFPAS